MPAEFAIDHAESTLCDGPRPFFIDRGTHPQLQLSPPRDDRATGETPEHYERRMIEIEATVREPGGLLAAAQAERFGPKRFPTPLT